MCGLFVTSDMKGEGFAIALRFGDRFGDREMIGRLS